MSMMPTRSKFERRRLLCCGLLLLSAAPALRLQTGVATAGPRGRDGDSLIGGPCDGCELIYHGMPEVLLAATRIVAPGEPGIPLQVVGRILQPDGVTPADGVILYVYQTDARGHYVPPGFAGPGLSRHGRLRGWVKTGRDGTYRFETIRPAPYPGREIPAHIHAIVKEPDKNEYYLDEFEFDDDPLLASSLRRARSRRGGDGILRAKAAADGDGLIVERDIVLGRNIPGYPSR
jgi:protocatechuate 3,4-dioxygenase, beta subunit